MAEETKHKIFRSRKSFCAALAAQKLADEANKINDKPSTNQPHKRSYNQDSYIKEGMKY